MRILIFSSTVSDTISVGKITNELYFQLKKHGHDVKCYCFTYSKEKNKIFNSLGSSTYNRIYSSISHHTLFRFHNNLFQNLHLKKIIHDFQPDIIQVIQPHSLFIDFVSFFLIIKKSRIPCVYTMIDEAAYLGNCNDAYNCERFLLQNGGCDNCAGENHEFYMNHRFFDSRKFFVARCKRASWYKTEVYSQMENICFVAPEWVIQRAQNSFLLHNKKFFVVDEFVKNDTLFYPRKDLDIYYSKLEIKNDKVIILNVASYKNKRKGVHYFIELAQRFEKNDNYVFINIGYDGPIDILPDNYIAISFMANQDELAAYYSLADLYITTSISDTMPNVCLDALSCGTPVCGFDVTGIPFVAKEPLGQFVPVGDISALSKIVSQTNKKNNEISSLCREYAVLRYSPDSYYKKMLSVYNKMKSMVR